MAGAEEMDARLERIEAGLDSLTETVREGFGRVERQSASVGEQFARVDGQFARVDEHFARVDERFVRVDEQFARVDERFTRVDEQFTRVDERFSRMDQELDRMQQALAGVARADDVDRALADQRQYTEFAFSTLRSEMHAGFDRLERKIDWIVEHLSNRS